MPDIKLKKSNIVLIGFMGAGKSIVGRLLAEKLRRQFVETANLIVQRAGKSIQEIFRNGEIAFRELEIEAIKSLATQKNQVIACGGGVVLNKINVDRLKLDGIIIWLTATPSVILKRTRRDGDVRPLIRPESGITEIRELLNYRKPYYQRAADLNVDTSGSAVEEVVAEIMNKLKEYAHSHP
jgi:shikimate kinase